MAAYIDFKALAEKIDVEQVASHVGLILKKSGKELRAMCPTCNGNDERSLALYPETNSFRCFAAQLSGDSISLYAHLQGTGNYAAAKALEQQFGSTANAAAPTAPTRPEGRTAKAQPAPKPDAVFDPEVFASKLTYTDEVEQLGLTEADATRLGIGYCTKGLMRGRVAFPIRDTFGNILGFAGYNSDGLKLPDKWLDPKVVPLKRKA